MTAEVPHELNLRSMDRTHDYQISSDTAPAIQTALTAQAAEGCRPILMSIAAIDTGQLQRFSSVASRPGQALARAIRHSTQDKERHGLSRS